MPKATVHDDTDAAAFGGRLRARRERRGLTQRWVADEAGLSRGYYCDVEGGKRSVSAQTLAVLADVLGTTMDELWRGLERGEGEGR